MGRSGRSAAGAPEPHAPAAWRTTVAAARVGSPAPLQAAPAVAGSRLHSEERPARARGERGAGLRGPRSAAERGRDGVGGAGTGRGGGRQDLATAGDSSGTGLGVAAERGRLRSQCAWGRALEPRWEMLGCPGFLFGDIGNPEALLLPPPRAGSIVIPRPGLGGPAAASEKLISASCCHSNETPASSGSIYSNYYYRY